MTKLCVPSIHFCDICRYEAECVLKCLTILDEGKVDFRKVFVVSAYALQRFKILERIRRAFTAEVGTNCIT